MKTTVSMWVVLKLVIYEFALWIRAKRIQVRCESPFPVAEASLDNDSEWKPNGTEWHEEF